MVTINFELSASVTISLNWILKQVSDAGRVLWFPGRQVFTEDVLRNNKTHEIKISNLQRKSSQI